MNNSTYFPKAFVSASLKACDRSFVRFVEEILRNYRIQPFGTVGRHTAASENLAISIKRYISQADMVVIVATKRFNAKDLHTNKMTRLISNFLHTEAGMAYMGNKPIVVFVQKGADVGGFLPQVTQYIELDGTHFDLMQKSHLINSLLRDAHIKAMNNMRTKSLNDLFKAGVGFFAVIGLANSLE